MQKLHVLVNLLILIRDIYVDSEEEERIKWGIYNNFDGSPEFL